ncbi:MAG: F420-dependent NADP oxidoreductase [Dehalococcoidales bacterium]|nr:F420-dependent NADP oxidoreductase [Dehalococcoidales bacterium]|tara:strand:- start:568 stop:1431 length:864 start_codon:yes stop_codon:yes gene_type:complete
MIKIGFIGAGTVATALAVGLHSKGYSIVAVSSRNQTSATNLAQLVNGHHAVSHNQDVADAADLVFIATPDDAITSVATQVQWRPGHSVVHCSGADSTAILLSARKSGAHIGVFHPLQTFADLREATKNIPGTTFALEAEEPLLGTLKALATALGGHWIELEAKDRVLYHAAAVFTCNYLITLIKLATDLWQTFAIPPEPATQSLLPLIRGTVNNIDTLGIPGCLTGPIARGDSGTIKKHLSALQKVVPDLVSTYQELGLKTIPIALEKGGINQKQANELKAILRPTI